jgi:hypothetical protein
VDVLLPMKVQDKLLPTLDALLDDKQVGIGRFMLCAALLLSCTTELHKLLPTLDVLLDDKQVGTDHLWLYSCTALLLASVLALHCFWRVFLHCTVLEVNCS